MDIGNTIEALKLARNETPAVASYPSAPLRKTVSSVESVQQAKATEFPTKPAAVEKKKASQVLLKKN